MQMIGWSVAKSSDCILFFSNLLWTLALINYWKFLAAHVEILHWKEEEDKDPISPFRHLPFIFYIYLCLMGRLPWDRWDLLVGSAWLCSRQTSHPIAGASRGIWCSIGTGGKWDYSGGNGIDSILDRFTDPRWIEYRRKGCKTHHLWGELHTAWNNLFGLGNPRPNLIWFTPPPLPVGAPRPATEVVLLLLCCRPSRSLIFSSVCASAVPRQAVLALWSVSCLQQNNSILY